MDIRRAEAGAHRIAARSFAETADRERGRQRDRNREDADDARVEKETRHAVTAPAVFAIV